MVWSEARRSMVVEMLQTSRRGDDHRSAGALWRVTNDGSPRSRGAGRRGVARRTHGGAVLPSIAANEHSFRHRLVTRPRPRRAGGGRLRVALAGRDGVSGRVVDDVLRRAADRRARLAGAGDHRTAFRYLHELRQRPGRHRGGRDRGHVPRLTCSYVGPAAVRRYASTSRIGALQRHRPHPERRHDRRRHARGRGQAGDARAGRAIGVAARRFKALRAWASSAHVGRLASRSC